MAWPGKYGYICGVMFRRIKEMLQLLSFRTGVIVLLCCVPCYIVSFAQMALPISAYAKGALWVVFFGLAKTFQYAGLTIVGVEGVRRLKQMWRRRTGSCQSSGD